MDEMIKARPRVSRRGAAARAALAAFWLAGSVCAAEHAPAADPLDAIRDRLAQKLGARSKPDAGPRSVDVPVREGVLTAYAPTEGRSSARRRAAAVVEGHAASGTGAPGAMARTAPVGGHAAHELHWDYAGEAGPDGWSRLKPEFATCSNGQRQSPIDIRGGVRVDLEPIRIDYRPGGFGVIDNAHTVQVNVAAGNSIEVGGRRYDLVQFHFHRPAEERIDGRSFRMVMHLVHKSADGRLAVVAVLLDNGASHPTIQAVWNALPLEKNEEARAAVTLDPATLLPADRRYYTYMGSLTTPPCTEGVLWMVMQQPVPLSVEQEAVFAHLYPMNARPLQSASGRLIKSSQ